MQKKGEADALESIECRRRGLGGFPDIYIYIYRDPPRSRLAQRAKKISRETTVINETAEY